MIDQSLAPASGVTLKYRLRLWAVPRLARVAKALGFRWETLGKYLGREVMLAQTSEGFRRVHARADSPLDIVFLTMIGGHTHNASLDIVLGLALRARGHRVRFVVCDQTLAACEVKKAGQEAAWPALCGKCWAFGERFFTSYGFEILPVSSFTSAGTNKTDQWSEFIEAAMLKHFGVGILHDTDETDRARERLAYAADQSATIARSLIPTKPDRVVMSHGIYCTWGPARTLLNEAGIPVLTYGKGKKRQTEKFNWTTGADWWDVSKEWERVRHTPLTPSQERKLDDYLASRRSHGRDTLVYNFGAEETRDETNRRLGLDPDRTTFTLFTNVLWDAASAHREIVFNDPVEWVTETIDWFARNPDKQLVVKVHPAEVVIGTNQPFASILAERTGELPKNVRLIEPHEPFNSWSIASITDLGLVHTSTVGMELPLEGIPCVTVSRTHFRDRGFTIDVEDRAAYFLTLARFTKGQPVSVEGIALARRYAYLLFERYQLPLTLFVEPSHTQVCAFAFDGLESLLSHPTIDLLSESIESIDDFLMPEDPDLHWT